MAESLYQESIQLTGLPGATAQSRYVGATVSGYPTSGSFVTGDFIIDQSGTTWVCTSGGSPGTWLNPLNKVTNSVASAYYTSQTAQLGPINLYTAPASGFYQLNYYAKVTSTGTTSTLGPITVTSTDIDGTSITNYGDATSANTVASGFINGMIPLLVGSGTTISYTIPYTSSGSPMGYEAYVNLTSTNLTQNASPVVSFNGRTGAVTPGSSDYTAAQVGAISNVSTAGGRNFLINGAMEISQRNGTSSLTVNNTLLYTVDRFFLYNAGATAATAQKVTGTNNGTPNSIRISGPLSLGSNFAQRIESNQLNVAAGQTVIFSGFIYGSTSLSSIATYCIVPTAVDNYASTTTVSGSISSLTVNTGTGTTKFSVTFTLPSTAVNGAEVGINFGAALSSGAYVDISELQLEIGSTATAFSRAGGTIQGELAACQRYFYKTTSFFSWVGNYYSTTAGILASRWPVTMRAIPTVTIPSTLTTAIQVFQLGSATPTAVATSLLSATDGGINATGLSASEPVGQSIGYDCTTYPISISAEL